MARAQNTTDSDGIAVEDAAMIVVDGERIPLAEYNAPLIDETKIIVNGKRISRSKYEGE